MFTRRSPPRRLTSSSASASSRRRKAIWSAGPLGGQAAGEFTRFGDLRFVDGRLTAEGMTPLALPVLAAKAHELGLVTAAMVHGYNRWSWAHATFDLPDGRYEGAIDALAVRYGNGASAARKALMIDGRLSPLRPGRGDVPARRSSSASASAMPRRAEASSPSRSTRRLAPLQFSTP